MALSAVPARTYGWGTEVRVVIEQMGAPGAWATLERLAPESRTRLEDIAERRSLETGDVVFAERAETPFLGIVERGRVALRLRTPELGGRVTIATIEAGELLGWSALVAPFRTTAEAVATEHVQLLAFDAPALRARLASDAELAADLLPLALETVAHRLTTSWHQLIDEFAPRSRGPW